MNETDIQISGAGTSMLNFPFLNDNCVHVNLGVQSYAPNNVPSLLETNLCLLSNTIFCEFYDVYKYVKIEYDEIKYLIDKNINNLNNNNNKNLQTTIPIFTKKWRELCSKKNMNEIIYRMNNEKNA